RMAAFGRRAGGGDEGDEGEAAGDGDDTPGLPQPPPGETPPPEPREPRCPGGPEPGDEGDTPRAAAPQNGARGPEASPSSAPGTARDGGTAGEPRPLLRTTKDVRARGPDTGRGKSRRQVILAAATRGFRGAGYHDAFVEYQTVARERLEQDRIPDGHKFYVR